MTIFFFNFVVPSESDAQTFCWVQAPSVNTYSYGQATAVDQAGNIYVTGYFSGSITLGTYTLANNGGYDIFIVKYDSTGNVLWANSAGGSGNDCANSVATDASGNVYITGYFDSPSITFGSYTLTNFALSYSDVFLVKYDSNGKVLWAKSAGGTSVDRANSVTTDASGNVFITGYFDSPSITFGSTTLTKSGGNDVFLVKYDSNGNVVWATGVFGSGDETANSIAADASGNVYISGYFTSANIYVPHSGMPLLSNSGGKDIFIIKFFSYDGMTGDAKSAIGAGDDIANSVSIDASGNIYLAGNFNSSSLTFGTVPLTNTGGNDIFLVKYDSNLNVLIAKSVGGTGDDYANSVARDTSGNVYVSGNFNSSSLAFGSNTLTNSGGNDIFLVKYDSNLNVLWANSAGGTGNDYANSASPNASGNVYLTGCFYSNPISFGYNTLSNSGNPCTYLAKTSLPNLSITSPAGNESWQINTNHKIIWNSNAEGNIKIELSTDSGSAWTLLADSINAGAGYYNFTVPSIPNSSDCKIRLTSTSYGNVSTTSGTFSITSSPVSNLILTSPNSALNWRIGSTQSIIWTINGSVDNVKLEYTTDNGSSWNIITASTPASTLSYSWLIPDLYSVSCRIRISDASNSAVNDISSALFRIYRLTLTSGVGGECWIPGTIKNITWTSNLPNINLYYSTNSGNSWIIIATEIAGSRGTYAWTVPSLNSTNCKLKTVDASDTSCYSISPNCFTIRIAIQSVKTSPPGPSELQFDATHIFMNVDLIQETTITITYYPIDSPAPGTLPSGVVNVSSYYWTASATTNKLNICRVFIFITDLPGVTDGNSLVWLARQNSGDPWTNLGNHLIMDVLLPNSYSTSLSYEYAIGTTSGSNPLPVDLSDFTYKVSNNSVNLTWSTKTEVNNSRFDIERKADGGTFTVIGSVKGAGNSSSPKEYSFADNNHLANGKYYYRLKQVDINGKEKYSNHLEVTVNSIPVVYSLENNYPNPFNPSTVIRYELPFDSHVRLIVYNSIGQKVKEFVNETKSAGNYQISFNASNLAGGIYFYSIHANSTDGKHNYYSVKKMLLLK